MTQKHEPFGDLTLGEEETYDALAACYDDMTAECRLSRLGRFYRGPLRRLPLSGPWGAVPHGPGPGLRHRHHVFFIGRAGL